MTENPNSGDRNSVVAASGDGRWGALIVALAIGLVGVVGITFFTHWYEVFIFEMKQRQLIVNSLTPIVFFLGLVLVLVINPIIHRLLPSLKLGRRELVYVLSMWLLTGVICYKGLGMPVMNSIGNVLTPEAQRSQMKRTNFSQYHNPDLYLPPEAGRQYYFGLSDGMKRVDLVPPSATVDPSELMELVGLGARLREPTTPLDRKLSRVLSDDTRSVLDEYLSSKESLGAMPTDSGREAPDIDRNLRAALAADLNGLLVGPLMYTPDLFPKEVLREGTRRTVNRCFVEVLFADSVRANPIPVPWDFRKADVRDLAACARMLRDGDAPLARHLRENIAGEETLPLIDRYLSSVAKDMPGKNEIKGRTEALDKDKEEEKVEADLRAALVADLNAAVGGPVFYSVERCAGVDIGADNTLLMNRMLLNDALPESLTPLRASVPWRQWAGPLFFWVPFMLVVILFSSSLIQMVHRQWSQHELLTYPIAEFADGYTRQKLNRAFPDIFYDKVFWIGFILISVVFIINGLNKWFPLMIRVPLDFRHTDLLREFTFLSKYCGGESYSLLRGMAYPFMVCLVVLLPTEVSLSGWMGWVLSILGIGVFFFISGENIGRSQESYIRYGMYVAMLAMIIIIGRREYLSILRHTFRLRPASDPLLRRAVTACRVFVFAFVLLVVLLTVAGLDWFVAFVLACSFALLVILIARMSAELGLPWLVSFSGQANALPLKLLGAAAMGPKAMALLVTVGGVLDMHTENTVAAQETTYRKLEEKAGRGMTRWRFNTVLAFGVVAAITVTIFVLLWNNYSYGSQRETRASLSGRMDNAAREIGRLKIESQEGDLERYSGIGKISALKGADDFYRFFFLGTAVVVFVMVMRLRFTWWPFHPLPFLLIGTWCMSRLSFSFFLGWLIKVALLKIGGGKFFARSKPFFMGIVAGQIAVAGLFVTSGAIYYVVTGRPPPAFRTFF